MAPRLGVKIKFKAKKLFSHASPGPTQAPVQTTPPASPQPATSPASRPISQPPPSASLTDDSEISPPLSIQERLWNRAYDDLKSSEPKLVEAYEKFLSADLGPDGSASAVSGPAQNKIATVQETRSRQMQRFVQAGLDRTENQTSIKEQIILNPIAEARHHRKGITYVLLRMEWYWNLAPLVLDDANAGQRALGLRDQLETHIVSLYGKLLSYQMKSISLYHRNWASVIGRDMVKIDDWAGQFDEIREAERAVQRDIEQYSTQGNKIRLQQLTDVAGKMHMNLDSVSSAIRDQTGKSDKRYNDDKDTECIQALRETDPRDDKSRIESAKGGLLRDSYRWILQNDAFQKWHNDPEHQLLWIKGDPGKGKTMLLCGIIDELEKERDTHIAYFFCQATRGTFEQCDKCKQLFGDGNAWEALSKILKAMLNDPSLDGAILVIDALDECKTGRGQLLDFITKPSRVKWVVSSRNWLEIEQKLDNQKFKIQLELNADSISQAVDVYIGDKVEKLASLKKYDTKTRDDVQRYLSDNANGTFLWVALVCQELVDERVVRKVHTFSKLNTFPSGLDSLYERMLEQISDSIDADICKEALAIASVVYRPIVLKELRVLIKSLEDDTDVDALSQIIKSCGSFLIVQEETVYFVHQSAKDFLLSKASDEILPFGAANQHHAIFLSSVSIDEVSSPMLKPLRPIQYPYVYWVDHLCQSDLTNINSALQDHGGVYRFIQEKFLYWLEPLSLLYSMSDGSRRSISSRLWCKMRKL
ncbi:hypothetical protein N3K66_000481 [Trichothecium roseum]|uniref:Uncharacterized protein n=1 Tax=Trichothecium roseum TaxID=47278 RepID=A0ACC0VDI7_9HYPO|nr:hypothetical protein N3K66_000481 [Trichothecium roseum]